MTTNIITKFLLIDESICKSIYVSVTLALFVFPFSDLKDDLKTTQTINDKNKSIHKHYYFFTACPIFYFHPIRSNVLPKPFIAFLNASASCSALNC